MGSCVSTAVDRKSKRENRHKGVFPDEVNRLLDKWAIGHVMVCVFLI